MTNHLQPHFMIAPGSSMPTILLHTQITRRIHQFHARNTPYSFVQVVVGERIASGEFSQLKKPWESPDPLTPWSFPLSTADILFEKLIPPTSLYSLVADAHTISQQKDWHSRGTSAFFPRDIASRYTPAKKHVNVATPSSICCHMH